MPDDLGARLRALAERAPDGDPDLAPVLRGGRKRGRRRRIAGAGAALLVVVAGLVAVPKWIDGGRVTPDDVATHEDEIFVPAENGAATYELFDLEILYPWAPVDERPISADERDDYCATRSEWECGRRRDQAGFSYQWRWATKQSPGEVRCRVILTSRDGTVAGRAEWGLSGLETRSRRPDVIGVHVTKRPVGARAECEGSAYAPRRGFDVEFVRAETWTPTYIQGQSPPPDQIRLVFHAEALAGEHVDSRMCFMTVWFESGRKEKTEFTTNQGAGAWEFETGYPVSDPVVDAKLRCREIRARD